MRVNVYAEEMTERVEIVEKTIDGETFTGLRIYLELPATIPYCRSDTTHDPATGGFKTTLFRSQENVRGPFMHRPGDDDSSAVTFWGKRDLLKVLDNARALLESHLGRSIDHRANGD